MAGCLGGEVEPKLAHRQLLGGGDAGQPPRERHGPRQGFALFFCLHEQRQTVVLKSTEDKGFFHIAALPIEPKINFNHMLLGLPQSGGGVDFRSERVLTQLHQVSPKTDCYGRRVGDLHIPGDDQRAKAMKTLDHLLCLVVCHAVDPDGVDPRSGEVLAAEDR